MLELDYPTDSSFPKVLMLFIRFDEVRILPKCDYSFVVDDLGS
jgi:hypothetical protein